MHDKKLKIEVAENAGFCFGVKRAINIAFDLGRKYPNNVYTLGPIIHNPHVVKKLEEISVRMVENLEDINNGVMIVRSHGLPPMTIQKAIDKGLKIIDATCPFVKKVQTYAVSLKNEGYPVFLIGDKAHPEVLAIKGYVKENIIICDSIKNLNPQKLPPKIGVVAQTTQDYKIFKQIILKLLQFVKEIKIYNTICDSTIIRQESALKLAKKVDLMLVIGGKNSANTNRLVSICKLKNKKSFLLESPEEIDINWFNSIEKIGITAGASTPKWIINDIIEKIKSLC